jgi:hypothetical protein
MVAEDVTMWKKFWWKFIGGRSSAQREKEDFTQEEKGSGGGFKATEIQLREGGWRESQEGGFHLTDLEGVLLMKLQDVLKALVIHQDQRPRRTNIHCYSYN